MSMTFLAQKNALLALGVAILTGAAHPGNAPGRRTGPSGVTTKLTAQAAQGLTPPWRLKQATSEEDFGGFTLTATLENVSGRAIPSAYFFGRYYDARGRLCFIGLFSLGDNLEGRAGPASPGEVRTLRSVSFLAPAAAPSLVKVSVVHSVEMPGRSRVPPAFAAPATPVMVANRSVSAYDHWRWVCLGGGPTVPDRPVVDIGLLRALVDARGKVEDPHVLDALTTRSDTAWLQDLAKHLNFIPASREGRPVASEALVLVRALVRGWRHGEPPFLPRANPWVKRAVSGRTGPLAPVEIIMLYPPHGGMPSMPPGSGAGPCFQYTGEGAAWSADFPYLVPPAPHTAR